MLDLEKIGKRISERRQKQNLTQEQLAEILHVTRQAVSRWEKGITIPSIDSLCSLSIVFITSIDSIIKETEIADNDFERLSKYLNRNVIISLFLAQNDLDKIEWIFSWATESERAYISEQIRARGRKEDIFRLENYLDQRRKAQLFTSTKIKRRREV